MQTIYKPKGLCDILVIHTSIRGYTTIIEVSCDIDTSKQKIRCFNYRLLRDERDPLANWQSRDGAARYVDGIDKIEKAEKLCKKAFCEIKRTIKAGHSHPAYTTMSTIARRTVKHFKSDFTFHDCLALGRADSADPFFWGVRSTGTWRFENLKGDFVQAVLRNDEGQSAWYYWNGYELQPENL